MKYMGSKRRIAKDIVPIMVAERKPNQYYVEPFCGGCNTLEHVEGNRIGADVNYNLIDMWIAVSGGWMPPTHEITESRYNELKTISKKNDPLNTNPLIGYTAFALSYGGKFWGGYMRDKAGKRNYSLEAYKNSLIQFPRLQGVAFVCASYLELCIPNPSIIYCDPPYAGTTKYTTTFNSVYFWKWCQNQVRNGHTVFVSEYTCPVPHVVLYEKVQTSSLTKETGSRIAVEKLFKIL